MDVSNYKILNQKAYNYDNQLSIISKRGKLSKNDSIILISTCNKKCSPQVFDENNKVDNPIWIKTKVPIKHDDQWVLLKTILLNDLNRDDNNPKVGLNEFNKNVGRFMRDLEKLKNEVNSEYNNKIHSNSFRKLWEELNG